MNSEHYNELIDLSQKIYDHATETLTNYLTAKYCAIGNNTTHAESMLALPEYTDEREADYSGIDIAALILGGLLLAGLIVLKRFGL